MFHNDFQVNYISLALVNYISLALIAKFGDTTVNYIEPNHYSWRAFTDSILHCCVAILTWVLVYFHNGRKCFVLSNIIGECLLAGCFGSIVDADHFLVARTFSIEVSEVKSIIIVFKNP